MSSSPSSPGSPGQSSASSRDFGRRVTSNQITSSSSFSHSNSISGQSPQHPQQPQQHRPHSLLSRAQQQQSFASVPHHQPSIVVGGGIGGVGASTANVFGHDPSFGAFGQSTVVGPNNNNNNPAASLSMGTSGAFAHHHHHHHQQQSGGYTGTSSGSRLLPSNSFSSVPGASPNVMHLSPSPSFANKPASRLRTVGSKLVQHQHQQHQQQFSGSFANVVHGTMSNADMFSGGGGAADTMIMHHQNNTIANNNNNNLLQPTSAAEIRARELERKQATRANPDNMRDYLSDSLIQQLDSPRSPSRIGGGPKSRRGSTASAFDMSSTTAGDTATLDSPKNNNNNKNTKNNNNNNQFLNVNRNANGPGMLGVSTASTQRADASQFSTASSSADQQRKSFMKPELSSRSPSKKERRRFNQNDRDTKSSHVIETISVSELDKMKKLFDAHDVDKSGSIDEDELLPLLEELGHPMKKAQAIDLLAQVDVNGNGLLEFSEFLQLVLIFKNVAQFRLYDDQGGFSGGGASIEEMESSSAAFGEANNNKNDNKKDKASASLMKDYFTSTEFNNNALDRSNVGASNDNSRASYDDAQCCNTCSSYSSRFCNWFTNLFPFNHETGYLWAWEVILLLMCIYIWCVVTSSYAFADIDLMAGYLRERFDPSDIVVTVLIFAEMVRTCLTRTRVVVTQEVSQKTSLHDKKDKKEGKDDDDSEDDKKKKKDDSTSSSTSASSPTSSAPKMLSTIREITLNYVQSVWFILDLLALLPLRAMITDNAAASIILGHFRFFFLYHLKDIMSRKSFADIDRWFVYFFLSFAPIASGAAAFLAAVHVCAIAALRIGLTDTYAESVYVVLYSFSGAGLGDVEPQNDEHRSFYACLCIISMLVNGFVIGSIVSFFSSSDVDSVRKSRLVQTLAVLDFFQVPRPLQEEILQFQNHLMAKNIQAAFSSIVESLPAEMKVGLGLQVRIQLVRSVELFRMAHPSTQIALAQELFPVVLCPEEFVALAQEEGEEMFFISYGFVDVLTSGGVYIQTLKMYESFGAEVVLGPVQDAIVSHKENNLEDDAPLEITSWGKYFTSAKTLTYVELLGLGVPNFDLILRQFPRFRKTVEHVLAKPNWAQKIFSGAGKKQVENRRKESIFQTTENPLSGPSAVAAADQLIMNPNSDLGGDANFPGASLFDVMGNVPPHIEGVNSSADPRQDSTTSDPHQHSELSRNPSFNNISSSFAANARRQSTFAMNASSSQFHQSHSRPNFIPARADVRGKLKELGVADLLGGFDSDTDSANRSLNDPSGFFQHSMSAGPVNNNQHKHPTSSSSGMMKRSSDDELDAIFAEDPSLLEGEVPASVTEKRAWLEELDKMEAILTSAVAEAHTTFEEVGGDGGIDDVEEEDAQLQIQRSLQFQQQQHQQPQQHESPQYHRNNSEENMRNFRKVHSTASSVPYAGSSEGSFGNERSMSPSNSTNKNNNTSNLNLSQNISNETSGGVEGEEDHNNLAIDNVDHAASGNLNVNPVGDDQNESSPSPDRPSPRQGDDHEDDDAVIVEEVHGDSVNAADNNNNNIHVILSRSSDVSRSSDDRPNTRGQASRDRFELQQALQEQQLQLQQLEQQRQVHQSQQRQQQQQHDFVDIHINRSDSIRQPGTNQQQQPGSLGSTLNSATAAILTNNGGGGGGGSGGPLSTAGSSNTLVGGVGVGSSNHLLPSLRTATPNSGVSTAAPTPTNAPTQRRSSSNNNNNNFGINSNNNTGNYIINTNQLMTPAQQQFLQMPSGNNSFNTNTSDTRQGSSRMSDLSNVTGATEAHHDSTGHQRSDSSESSA